MPSKLVSRGHCGCDEGSADGLGVSSDTDGGGAGDAPDSPDRAGDGEVSNSDKGVGRTPNDAGVPVRDLIILLMTLGNFQPSASMLSSGFRFDMVDR